MSETSALVFPCEIPVKTFGLANDTFEQAVQKALTPLVLAWPVDKIGKRLSGDKKYLSLTIPVYAENREFIDKVYQALADCPEVLMCL